MAQAVLYSKAGVKKDARVKLSAKVFDAEVNEELVAQAYRIYEGNGRMSGAQTKTRGMVRGGGKKPWRQKGTGRARAGGTRLPHWTGGGAAFGPTGNQNYERSLPQKAKRAAIRQALSLQAKDKKIIALETFECPEGKVRPTLELIEKMQLEGSILLVVSAKDRLVDRATRNVPGIKAVAAKYLNVADIINADQIVISQKGLEQINEWLEV